MHHIEAMTKTWLLEGLEKPSLCHSLSVMLLIARHKTICSIRASHLWEPAQISSEAQVKRALLPHIRVKFLHKSRAIFIAPLCYQRTATWSPTSCNSNIMRAIRIYSILLQNYRAFKSAIGTLVDSEIDLSTTNGNATVFINRRSLQRHQLRLLSGPSSCAINHVDNCSLYEVLEV